MTGYYGERLSAARLRQVYELATPRVRRYLDAEVEHVLAKITPGDFVLELGCGYGRVLTRLAARAAQVVGIDTSLASLLLGREALSETPNCRLIAMDAASLAFREHTFDVVACIQNGVSAFHVDPARLLGEAIRVAKRGGLALFSSYSDRFWKARLEWFELQAGAGLLGEIDYGRTGDGTIVCKDGFTATTISASDFRRLTQHLEVDVAIVEVDNSSVFCEMVRR